MGEPTVNSWTTKFVNVDNKDLYLTTT